LTGCEKAIRWANCTFAQRISGFSEWLGKARQRRSWGKGSRFRGVYAVPSGRWAAKARIDGVLCRLGTFDAEEDAARAYDAAVRHLPGATLNFPPEMEA